MLWEIARERRSDHPELLLWVQRCSKVKKRQIPVLMGLIFLKQTGTSQLVNTLQRVERGDQLVSSLQLTEKSWKAL